MKQNRTRSYLKCVFIFLGVSLLFTNCEHEIAEDIVQAKKSRFRVQILNEKEVESNTLISKKLSDFNAKLSRTKESYNSQAKEIYNAEYDFTINTDFVKYIEDTETQLHSYNFPLTRIGNTEDKIENLLLALNTNGEYSAFIVTYDFNKDEFSNSQEGTVLDRDTNYLPIDFDTSVFNEGELSNKMVATLYCLDVYEYTKVENNQGNLNGDTPLWTWEWIVTSSHCSWGYHDDGTGGGDNTGGEEGTGNSSSGQGGLGTSSNSPTPDNTYDPTDPNNHGNDNTPPLVSAPAVEDDEENDCLPHFTCRPGELLDADCICQIDLDDPCANRDLLNYAVSPEVLSILESRQQPNTMVQSNMLVDSFILETVDDGWGDVNQDKFTIKIDELPNGYTPFQLFNEIRLNLGNMISGGDVPFITQVDFQPYSTEDGETWNSDNPLGAAMDFQSPADTSTVYCVDYNAEEMYWVFATVTSYDHQGHFVAGVRQFGLEPNGSGGYSFYVRAADRLGGVGDYFLNYFSGDYEVLYKLAGDATWRNLMENVSSFTDSIGGFTSDFDIEQTYGGRHLYVENGCP